MQDCSNSIANALELLQSCTKPSKYDVTNIGSDYLWHNPGAPFTEIISCKNWDNMHHYVALQVVCIWYICVNKEHKIELEIVPTLNLRHRKITIWVRSRNCGCLVTWFCYQLIAKPGNKTATVLWPDPYSYINMGCTHSSIPYIQCQFN